VYSYVRWSDTQKLIVIANFSAVHTSHFDLKIPANVIAAWKLKDGVYPIKDQLYGKNSTKLQVVNGEGKVQISIAPLESFIYGL
jgi:hypothetical protein